MEVRGKDVSQTTHLYSDIQALDEAEWREEYCVIEDGFEDMREQSVRCSPAGDYEPTEQTRMRCS